ncbi:MAG TPA: (2Fe-2S)-binding protein [Gemmatimonadales bacterium]|jgi:hypothetical protein
MEPDLRITHDVQRGEAFAMNVDGSSLRAFPGETVAGALLAAGRYRLRYTTTLGHPRGVFCGMGACHDCRMTIDGRPNQRACVTAARPGCHVATQVARGRSALPQ